MPELVQHFDGRLFTWRFEDEPGSSPSGPTPAAARGRDMTGLNYDVVTGAWSVDPAYRAKTAEMVEVSEAGVAAWRRELAGDILAACLADERVGLPSDVVVRWYKPESETQRERRLAGRGLTAHAPLEGAGDLLGFVEPERPNEMWVRADLELGPLAETLGHEVYHLQHLTRALEGDDAARPGYEVGADRLGREIRAIVEDAEATARARR